MTHYYFVHTYTVTNNMVVDDEVLNNHLRYLLDNPHAVADQCADLAAAECKKLESNHIDYVLNCTGYMACISYIDKNHNSTTICYEVATLQSIADDNTMADSMSSYEDDMYARVKANIHCL